jgi:hypothetical protein
MRILLPLTLATLVAVFATACNMATYKAEATLTESAPHLADAALDIHTRNGAVTVLVSPDRDDVMITAEVRCAGSTQQEANQRLAQASLDIARDTARTLVIRPVFPGGYRNGDACSFRILMPGVNGLAVNTSNGELRFENTAGLLDARTSNGRITAESHDGEVDVRTSNGRVAIVNVTGPVAIDTSNGRVKLVLAPGNPNPFSVDSSNGAINVAVGPAYNGTINLRTSNGSIDVDDDAGRANRVNIQRSSGTVEVGGDPVESTVRTSNGSINITIADDAEIEALSDID